LSVLALGASAIALADWEDHERLSRDRLVSLIDHRKTGQRLELPAKNLSNLDLSRIDFHAANLSASIFNGANLTQANLDDCNLTVSFFEGAKLNIPPSLP
jgi:uncharacterized protein YjbI with pentapeptide repeats